LLSEESVIELSKIDAQMVRQLAALNGFELSLERAEALAPTLQEILKIDAQIAQLLSDPLTTLDLPLRQRAEDNDNQS
jgi:hypothetical protein